MSNNSLITYLEALKEIGILNYVTQSVKHLCNERYLSLLALEIDQCDAGVGFGVSFSQASCLTTEIAKEFYPFASVFVKGLSTLNKILRNFEHILDNTEERKVIEILFKFLINKENTDFILTIHKRPLHNERQLAIALVEHVFSKLTKPGYVVNKHQSSKDFVMCRCGCEKVLIENQADTSIGHEIAWHGYIDVILSDSVPVIVLETPNSSGGKTSVTKSTQQIISQTIVFSFLQRQRHPDMTHFLVPCIVVSYSEITFYMYDSENDVLLKSSPMPFRIGESVNFELIMALWLTLNYKQFGSGLSDRLQFAPKAKFFEHANKYLDIYRDNLSQGEVMESVPPYTLDPCRYPHAKFVTLSKFEWPLFN